MAIEAAAVKPKVEATLSAPHHANVKAKVTAVLQRSRATIHAQEAVVDAFGHVQASANLDLLMVKTSHTAITKVIPPANVRVIVFDTRAGVDVTFNDGPAKYRVAANPAPDSNGNVATIPSSDPTHVDRIVVGSAGNDRIIVQDAKNTHIALGSGDSTVLTGEGVDTVDAGLGNSVIVGGSGDYAVVKLAGNAANYQVTAANGHAVVTNAISQKTTDISKIQYVQLDNGEVLVFAKDSVEAQVATLFHTCFGRDADAAGLDYWFDMARTGASMKQIATGFVDTAEFEKAHPSSQDDTAFIQSLYLNTFGRAGDDLEVAALRDALAQGSTKADVVNSVSQIAVQNLQNSSPGQKAPVAGNITIVDGII